MRLDRCASQPGRVNTGGMICLLKLTRLPDAIGPERERQSAGHTVRNRPVFGKPFQPVWKANRTGFPREFKSRKGQYRAQTGSLTGFEPGTWPNPTSVCLGFDESKIYVLFAARIPAMDGN